MAKIHWKAADLRECEAVKYGQSYLHARMTQNTQKRSRNARIREPIDVKLAGTVSRAKTHHRDGGMRPEHPIE